jgi:hypothetical protein
MFLKQPDLSHKSYLLGEIFELLPTPTLAVTPRFKFAGPEIHTKILLSAERASDVFAAKIVEVRRGVQARKQ